MARSYVSMLAIPDPIFSTPDDFSPRDRQGHGTAIAMIAAGVQNTGPLAHHHGRRAEGVPRQLQNLRFPGLNEFTFRSAWIQALTDAVNDGMDIVTLSLGEGDPAFFGPLDKGTDVCGDGHLRRGRAGGGERVE